MATGSELKPWGRFKLVSKDPAAESDHIYFYRTETRIGRNPQRAHAVLDMLFISGVHCIVKLDGEKENGDPLVTMLDLSRNGIFINEVRIDKDAGAAEITSNATIHFTKPGLSVKTIPPTVYRFEILGDGLTPENARLRAVCDREPLQQTTARANTTALATPATPGTTRASAPIATTQLLTGKRQRRSDDGHMLEEMEVEILRTQSTGGVEATSSAKRRRTGDRSRSGMSDYDDDAVDMVRSSTKLHDSNQMLRKKLSDAADRETQLKHLISQRDRDMGLLKDELMAAKESRTIAENEAILKGERLADREHEIDRLNKTIVARTEQMESLQADVVAARKAEAALANVVAQLQAEREKLDMDMVAMTSQLDKAQTKSRQAEEQLKLMYDEKKKLELALDSAQTRSNQVEEGKRGLDDESMFLKARIKTMIKLFKSAQAILVRGAAMGEDDSSIISAELEALTHSDPLLYSSEHSQPAPTQENYIGDTQADDGDDEQTLDQDAAAARAGLVAAGRVVNLNPFDSDHSKISLHQNVSLELLDDQPQPLSSFSTDASVNETPAEHTDGKLSLSESTMSSNSSSSKTPPAPPPKRQKMVPLHEVEETKGTTSDADDDGEEEAEDKEDKDKKENEEEEEKEDEDNEHEETVLPDEEEAEKGKEDTPVKPAAGDGPSTGAEAKPPIQPDQQGWLQMIVTNEDDKSEQVSASEGGGIFDDETQLSGGEE